MNEKCSKEERVSLSCSTNNVSVGLVENSRIKSYIRGKPSLIQCHLLSFQWSLPGNQCTSLILALKIRQTLIILTVEYYQLTTHFIGKKQVFS